LDHFVIISGCSGGGKSSLLTELQRRGYAVVAEPGRRIVAEERARQGRALPWLDLTAFARRAIAMSIADRNAALGRAESCIFFDRSLVDAAVAFEHGTGAPVVMALGMAHRYGRRVFMTPPWPEIYVTDSERQHGFADALAE
jgi:predicted ATPase